MVCWSRVTTRKAVAVAVAAVAVAVAAEAEAAAAVAAAAVAVVAVASCHRISMKGVCVPPETGIACNRDNVMH